ncbi:hypothetical protein BG011_008648 [Mortierella polycephala]|uniref:Uncharacterized protein n=1 Tax=Mortierella polycephala TaxID=41804 RepID=A0A9P6PPJ6_9FUNG|nr:hypothetical protein BG011_008648 [Mortierella polycephala]
MTSVGERLIEAHDHLLKLYTSIPVITPCLQKIKTNQVEFVHLNNRIRDLPEIIAAGQAKADKVRKQLDSVFTINKTESERNYHQVINELKAFEDERRACLRQRDDIVTVKYQLNKERGILLEQTRQLKKLTESVFDRSKDAVANADFPDELYWQLELKDYDLKISESRRQLLKYNNALSNLARAANLSEAALMALLGYPEAAYKVWRVEYALQASRKMRLYLRVELSLSNAYANEDLARESCPRIVPPLTTPVKPSDTQSYFEPVTKSPKGRKKIQPFTSEDKMRYYIAQLRSAHRTAELMVAQETERLNAIQAYRESIIPRLARIRRHVFQTSCLYGYKIEGWEDDQGRSLLGTEADILVRGGIHEIEISIPTILTRHSQPGSSSMQTVPGSRRSSSGDAVEMDGEAQNTIYSQGRRGNALLSDTEDNDAAIVPSHPASIGPDTRVILQKGGAPLSTLAPANVLGLQVLMEVDRHRQAKINSKRVKDKSRTRSRSRSGQEPEQRQDADGNQAQGSVAFGNGQAVQPNNSVNSAVRGEPESSHKKMSRGLFGFVRGRKNSSAGSEDAAVPQSGVASSNAPSTSQFVGFHHRNSLDVVSPSSNTIDRSVDFHNTLTTHRRDVPSISISMSNNNDGGRAVHPLQEMFLENSTHYQPSAPAARQLSTSFANSTTDFSTSPSQPRIMSMDEYIDEGPADRIEDGAPQLLNASQGSIPRIPSYAEHQQHQTVDPRSVFMGSTSPPVAYDDCQETHVVLQDAVQRRRQNQRDMHSSNHRDRSRSLSPNPLSSYDSMSASSSSSNGNNDNNDEGARSIGFVQANYQRHQYPLSDQSPNVAPWSVSSPPPPDYVVRPPEYSA